MVTLDDLKARYPGEWNDADNQRAQAALDDAQAAVAAAAGGPLPPHTPPLVAALTLRVALRVFTNPLGMASETLGDYTWRRDGGAVGGALTDDERAELLAALGRAGLDSVRTPHGWSPDDVSRVTAVDPPYDEGWSW